MESAHTELDRQIALLSDAKLASADALASLRSVLARLPSHRFTGAIPFCIAMRKPPIAALMRQIGVRDAHGIVDMTPCQPDEFHPIEGITIPGDLYLLIDLDTGRQRLNVTPEASLAALRAEGRTPLTLEEGVMLAFLFPVLTDKRFNAIQMTGSRRSGDQRVPSIWVSKGAPRLGWCWDRNPHTWLASASAALRI
jgi:hypothetical protein